jgi:hypothetical protein
LQNIVNRWYDPTVGRWIGLDPIAFRSGTTNLFVYCGNSPTHFVDPLGTTASAPAINARGEKAQEALKDTIDKLSRASRVI